MKKSLLALTCAVSIPLFAGPWVVDTPEPGTVVLRNEEGKFKGSKAILYMTGNGLRLQKKFDLSKLPEGMLAKAKTAKLRVYCNITDYTWGKVPAPQALDESIAFTINGKTMICKTSDLRFPQKKTIKAPQHYRWVDIEFPIAWIKNGKMEVVIYKMSSIGANDFFYQAVDIDSPTTDSKISSNGGASFSTNGGCIKNGKGEGMVRLVLSEKGEDIPGVPGSDISSDKNICKMRPLFLFHGAAAAKDTIVFKGTPKNVCVLPGSGSFNYTGYGMTLSGVFRFSQSENKNMVLFYKQGAFYLIRKGDKFFVGITNPQRKWEEFELAGDMPEDNKFFHIAAVFKPAEAGCSVQLYIDGMMADEKDLPLTIPANKNGINIGAGLTGFDFCGELAEVSCFHRTLSDTDILNIVENFPILRQK